MKWWPQAAVLVAPIALLLCHCFWHPTPEPHYPNTLPPLYSQEVHSRSSQAHVTAFSLFSSGFLGNTLLPVFLITIFKESSWLLNHFFLKLAFGFKVQFRFRIMGRFFIWIQYTVKKNHFEPIFSYRLRFCLVSCFKWQWPCYVRKGPFLANKKHLL